MRYQTPAARYLSEAVQQDGCLSTLIIGDSITKGVCYDDTRHRHMVLKEGFCNLAAQKLRLQVENLSRFGCLSAAALETLKTRLVKPALPKLVVIELGGNDCDFDWNAVAEAPESEHEPFTRLEAYEENLTEMIELVQEAGSQAVLMNLPPIDAQRYFRFFTGGDANKQRNVLQWLGEVGRIYWWHERYNAVLERVAQMMRTPLVMIRSALLAADDYRAYVSDDGIHPNQEGHKRMADLVLSYTREFLPQLIAI